MLQDIYDPLNEYINVFRDRFKNICKTTFENLAKEAHVDVDANRKTCQQIYEIEAAISEISTKTKWWIFLCVLLWIISIAAIVSLFLLLNKAEQNILLSIIGGTVLSFVFLFAKVHPTISSLKKNKKDLTNTVNNLRTEAWNQMASLNCLYDWDMLTRMMTQTVPKLEFDPYFTTQRLVDLKKTYGWDDSFNQERSVLYAHSGLINGNPFVLCRTRKMHMGTKEYYGSKTIHWTSRELGSDGKYHTRHHSQTLTATVTAPYPEYPEKTRLIYGNTAAPDLIFYRKQNDLAGKEGSFAYRRNKRKLKKQARDLSNKDFAMMSNEEFEVAFNTSNRNDNQQFALLFTPLAQESMLNLLKDESVGYGDDFDFDKNKMINTIVPDHLQELSLDLNPEQYQNFDFKKAREDFHTLNARYFRAIYFSFAPLLCVPMYQQIRSQKDIYGHDMAQHSTFWEHESLANHWGETYFKHPKCVTHCILKTEERQGENDYATVTVHAYGYKSVQRLTHVTKWGGDGYPHEVPVYWDEYLPVTGKGDIALKEDNESIQENASQRERLSHINSVLQNNDLTKYRRHIASKIIADR